MKKRVLVLALISALLLSACGSIYDAEYVYSAPYDDETQSGGSTEGEDIRSYAQLESAITAMVNGAQSGGKLRFSNYSGSVADDIAVVCNEIKTQTPMGAYAVEELTYDLSRIVSYYTAEVFITYKRSAAEIRGVVTVNGISALKNHLSATVAGHDRREVLRVYSSAVNEEYIRGLVHQACLDAPLICDGEPEVKVTAYPGEGVNRIYDIELSYAVDGSAFARRRTEAEERLQAVCAPLTGKAAGETALGCAAWLAENCDAGGEGEEDTAYYALLDGRAGSLGFAMAYKAMCDTLGLECLIVEGSLGTLGTQTHFWNIVGIDGDYYHIDVSRIRDVAWEAAFLLSDDMAWGTYMWDAGKYPACNGALRYDDLDAEPSEAPSEDGVQPGRPVPSAPSDQPPEPTPNEGDDPTSPPPVETDAPQEPPAQEE